ncbi:MAG: sortase [Anaerolineae bacterium]|nr:sortase [Anaerolineae bacterium]
MRDKRPVDELSIEELERILAIRKREQRQVRLRRFGDRGRRIEALAPEDVLPELPQQHEAAENLPPVDPPVTYDLTDELPRFEDDLDDERPEARRSPAKAPKTTAGPGAPARQRAAWDRLLLGVEVLAVVGILAVLFVGGYFLIVESDKIEALEQKSAAIQQEAEAMRPTPSPVPELSVRLSDYVLPGGHYSPQETGGVVAFNLEELPESVRPAALAQLTAPQAPLVTVQAGSPKRIIIPRIGVDASIYGGDDWFQLQKGVGHMAGSATPGERGNMVLSAHNDIYGQIFRDLQLLEPGDEFVVEADNGRRYTYVVQEKRVVKPTDVWVLQADSQRRATLITCHPYQVDNQRMVIFATLREE